MFQGADTKAVGAARPREREKAPGVWWLAIATLLSAVVCWFWLIPAVSSTANNESRAAISEVALASVDDGDVAAALATMIGPPEFLEKFKPSDKECAQPLAWLSISRSPGQPAGEVRIRSGAYISPLFSLPDAPLRIAIPYPAPYQTGHGTLTVFANGGRPTVELVPAWKIVAPGGLENHAVSWRPIRKCARPNG